MFDKYDQKKKRTTKNNEELRIDNTGHNLKNWQILQNNTCKHCYLDEEDLIHKYVTCIKNNNIFDSVNLWVAETLNHDCRYTNSEFLTGKPKMLDTFEIIYERVHLELKHYIHIQKTLKLMKDKPLFLNCIDFILHLIKKIKIEKELRSKHYIMRVWGDIAKLA